MSSILSPLILLAVMFLIFYFLLIRPQKKREKEHRNLLQELKKNDKVITIGGLHGVVERVKGDENEVVLKVDDNTKMTFSLSAIQAVIPRKSDEVDKPGAN
jgi:preprotein translocase subunit YajC